MGLTEVRKRSCKCGGNWAWLWDGEAQRDGCGNQSQGAQGVFTGERSRDLKTHRTTWKCCGLWNRSMRQLGKKWVTKASPFQVLSDEQNARKESTYEIFTRYLQRKVWKVWVFWNKIFLLDRHPFELWCWRRLLRVPWTARRSNQSMLKEISPEHS